MRGGVKAGLIQTLFRCERESRLAVLCGSRACAGRSAVPAVGGGGLLRSYTDYIHQLTPRGARAGVAGRCLRSRGQTRARMHRRPSMHGGAGRAVVDTSDLDVHF